VSGNRSCARAAALNAQRARHFVTIERWEYCGPPPPLPGQFRVVSDRLCTACPPGTRPVGFADMQVQSGAVEWLAPGREISCAKKEIAPGHWPRHLRAPGRTGRTGRTCPHGPRLLLKRSSTPLFLFLLPSISLAHTVPLFPPLAPVTLYISHIAPQAVPRASRSLHASRTFIHQPGPSHKQTLSLPCSVA
jgi:hypothetical protein